MKITVKILPYLMALLLFASQIGIAQNLDWVQAIGASGGDFINNMTVDADGNVYLTGRFIGSVDFGNKGVKEDIRTSVNENSDAFFAKYNPAGELVFVRTIFSTEADNGVGIQVDKGGNIYVSGVYKEEVSFENTAQKPLPWIGDNDIYVAKYTPAGEFIFAYRIGGVGNDRLPYFDVDDDENIYVTGAFDQPLSFFSSDQSESDKKDGIGQNDVFLAKYDKEGKLVFSKQIGGTDNDTPGAIKLDSRNNIYIAGNIASADFDPDQSTTRDKILKSTSNRNDIFIAKYNSNGEYIIAESVGGEDAESPNNMHVDADGNVYLTGRTDKNADFDPDESAEALIGEHHQDIFIAKYFPDLTLDFARSFGSNDEVLDRGTDIDVDSEGNIYITGEFNSNTLNLNPQNANDIFTNRGAGSGDGFLAKYTPDGAQLLFSTQIGGDGSDIGRDVAVDPSGNIYIAGEFQNTVTFDASHSRTAEGESDIFIAKYVSGITLSRPVATNANGTTHLHAADLDGDGALDIISANGPESDAGASSITWYKNDGQGNFTPQPVVADGIQIPKSVFGVDIDNDGDRDILAAIRADNLIVWYENQGGSFEPNTPNIISDALVSPLSLFPADFDGDGDLDILAASRDDDKITWFENRLNEESNDFILHSLDDAAESAQSVFAADLDGDGKLDALAAHRRNNGQISWYEITVADESARTLILKEEVNLIGAEFVSAADFDNDGIPEVIGVSANKISIYNIEGGVFSAPKELSGINGGEAVSMADMDGDGDLDIVSASFNDNKIAWYENLGNATADFGPQQIINLNAEGTRIVLTPDLDNDGAPDVLWAAETINKIAWAKNQLFTPVNPSITTFTPASGIQGNTITIYGTHFGDAPEVTFENAETSEAAPEVTPDDSDGVEKLIVTIPPLPKGTYKIKITDGAKVVVSVDDLLLPTLPVLQVTELNPVAGPVGTTLTIKGKNFGSDATKVQVKFGDTATLPVADTALSTTEIKVIVPELEENTYPVTVVVESLTSNNDKIFTVTAPDAPLITSLSVTSGAPGGKVTITGQNFGTEAGLVSVTFNETAADFTLVDETEIEVTVPNLPGGLYNIKVTVDGVASNEVDFTISGGTVPPSLSSIDPATMTVETTPTVTITGSGFGGNADNITVSFKNASEVITDVTDGINVTGGTEISFTAPALAVGAYTVSVTVDETPSDNTLAFTVQEASGGDPPSITDMPPFGNTEEPLVITGDNFGTDTNNTSVTFDGDSQSETADIVSLANDEIVVAIPDNLAEGAYDVTVSVNGLQTTFGNKFVIDNTPPTVSATEIPLAEYFVPGAAKEYTLTATDERSGILSVNLVYFGIRETEDNAQSAPFDNNGDNTYTIDIQSLSIADELGIAFHFVATDSAGNTARFPESGIHFLHKDQQNLTLPAAKATNSNEPKVSDYNLVAVPLDELTRDQVFGDLGSFGGGENNKWWLFEYNATNQDYSEVSSSSASLAPGKGYMLIFRNTATIQAEGKVLPVTPESPVTVSIAPGFNLIGNPFPFDMDWDDVVAFNTDVQGVDQLKFRKFSQGNWVATSNTFSRFEGALVINPATSAISLEIPFKKADTGGRYVQDEKKSKLQPLDAMAWEVPLRIETYDRYTLGGIGMHPEAATTYDPLDDFTVPRFLDYLELNFHHPEFFLSKFTKDIVPTQDAHVWEFEVASNLPSPEVTIHWENHYFGNNGQALMLLDLHNHQIVNMREATSYTFSVIENNRRFKVFFGDEEKVWENMLPESIAVREAYPNPMQHQFTIPVSLPGTTGYHELTVEIYNTTGQLVKRMHHENMPAGYHRVQWDRTNTDGQKVRSGLYFYRLQVNDQRYDGRIIAW